MSPTAPDDPDATKPHQGADQPTWVEKATFVVLALTFIAALYAGLEANRLADLTSDALRDARITAQTTHSDTVNTENLTADALGQAQAAATIAHSDTQAALGQTRDQFRNDQRPYIWLTDKEASINLVTEPTGGQVTWNWEFTNYGKSPGYHPQTRTDFWIDGKKCGGPPPPSRSARDFAPEGAPLPPGKRDFATAVSCQGIPQDRFNALLQEDAGLKITGIVRYQDAYGAKYETKFCLAHLRSGAILYCPGNNIK